MSRLARGLSSLSPLARAGWAAGAAAIGVIAVADVVYWLGHGDDPVEVVVVVLGHVVGGVAGLATWARRPDSRVGFLLVVWALVNLIQGLGERESGALLVLGHVVWPLIPALFAHALLTYPDGRPETAAERWFLRAVYTTPLLWLAFAAVSNSEWFVYCPQACPANPIQVAGSAEVSWVFWWAERSVSAACGLWFAVLMVRRYRRMSPSQRRTAAPVLWSVTGPLVVFVIFVVLQTAQVKTIWPWRVADWLEHVTNFWVPLAMAAGLLATRLARADVAATLVHLRFAPVDDLRPALARLLRDPDLEIAIPAHDPDNAQATGHIDPAGRPVRFPAHPGDERICTDTGSGILLLHHASTRMADPQLFDAAVATARLTLDNARLTAQVRAQLGEVSASRERIMRAADEERHRLERDLHDGAQQHLIGLGMSIRSARAKIDDESPVAKLLDDATDKLRESLSELRGLARGLRPALLTERGLEVALQALLRQAGVQASLSVELPTRPDVTAETAAYFVVAESLQNIARHAPNATATVDIVGRNGQLTVTVSDTGQGGADDRRGTGLRGLADRVATAGGRLSVSSPSGQGTTVTADLPMHQATTY